jgi:hypothetical protein
MMEGPPGAAFWARACPIRKTLTNAKDIIRLRVPALVERLASGRYMARSFFWLATFMSVCGANVNLAKEAGDSLDLSKAFDKNGSDSEEEVGI